MWMQVLAEAANNTPAQPPEISGSFIGILLTGLITGATAIAVALIQRGKRDRAVVVPFTVPESEWIASRDRSIRIEEYLEQLDRLIQRHIEQCDRDSNDLRDSIGRIKGHLGIQ